MPWSLTGYDNYEEREAAAQVIMAEQREAKLARLNQLRAKYSLPPAAKKDEQSTEKPQWTRHPSAPADRATSSRSQFRRLKQIGHGRFGEIYLCQEEKTERLLVLKALHSKNLDAPARFEAKTLLRLRRHPNIVELYDAFQEGPERLCLIMEYCDGGDLAQRIAAARAERIKDEEGNTTIGLPLSEALHVFMQVALALKHCHKHNVSHRDIKPANIFLTLQGIVRLGDFGIARDGADRGSHQFAVAGTPLYMAPEVLRGDTTSSSGHLADVWAVGCVLYEMVSPSLAPPFTAPNLPTLVRRIVTEPPTPLPDLLRIGARYHRTEDDGGMPDDTMAQEADDLGSLCWLLDGLLTKQPKERLSIEHALSGKLCTPLTKHYKPDRLRRSLSRETRLHEVLDGWSASSSSKRGSSISMVEVMSALAPMPAAAAVTPTASPVAGIEVLKQAITSQRDGGNAPILLQRSSTRALQAIVRMQSLSRSGKQDEEETVNAPSSSSSSLAPATTTPTSRTSIRTSLRASREQREAAALARARRATMLFEVAFEVGSVQAAIAADKVRKGSESLTRAGGEAVEAAVGGISQASVMIGRELSEGSEKLGGWLRRAVKTTASRDTTTAQNGGGGGEDARDLAAARTYACTDGSTRRPGQLWITSTHLCFACARGSRVVIHLQRIKSIHLPRGSRMPWRVGKAMHITLRGANADDLTVRKERFCGLFERGQVVEDIRAECGRNGWPVLLTG